MTTSFIDVSYVGREPDASLEATIHRWVARMAAIHIDITHVNLRVERAGWRSTKIALDVLLGDQSHGTAETRHVDSHAALSDAFRAVLHRLTAPSAASLVTHKR